jgi:hypothetical protein
MNIMYKYNMDIEEENKKLRERIVELESQILELKNEKKDNIISIVNKLDIKKLNPPKNLSNDDYVYWI